MVELFRILNHDSGVVRLPLQTNHLCMPGFAVDDNLRRLVLIVLMLLVACADAVLQFFYDRTGGIDDLYPALLRNPIRGRGLAVRPK